MSFVKELSDIVKLDEPLAPYTYLGLGGPARYLAEPRTIDELRFLLQRAQEEETPVYILGGGSNLLVRDEGVAGLVIRLAAPAFRRIQVKGHQVTAGCGATLWSTIREAARHRLSGLEVLAGIPGTIGGAIRMNAGGRMGDIGQFTTSVTVMDWSGEVRTLERDALHFDYRDTRIDEPIILEASFELEEDDPEAIARRMKRVWIAKKATQPLAFQSAGCIFKNTRGLSAGLLIEQAGLKGYRVGGAEVSSRHANFIIAHPGCTARDVLRLIEVIRTRVREKFGVQLELEIKIW
jgi:UDP-N-acetylmuramate dehydrogenase